MSDQAALAQILGYVGAACTTLSFVPQLVRIRRQGGADLSYFMLAIYLTGAVLWLLYGILLQASAVVVANAGSIVLVGAAIILKAKCASRNGRA